MPWIFLAVAIIVIIVFAALRNVNQNYTMGSNMFKNSDNNLEKDEHVDPADYDYYNKKDKMK